MPIFLLAASGAFGWCGTKWPGWWHGPRPPHPDPDPWWFSVIGLVVGVAVGFAASRLGTTGQTPTLVDVAATGLVAFAVAAVVADIARGLTRGQVRTNV